MNKNKIFTLLFLSAVGIPTFAQSVIYKCTDGNGEITYSTEASPGNCEKTNLAKVDKGNTMNKPSAFNSGTPNTINITVQNSDQIVRDQKRAIILQGELNQEKSQLKTVLEMISKADKNDIAQISQLKKMEETHKRNIASLEKELGVKGDNPIANPSNLPFNLPKEAKDVQLVEAPQPPKTQHSQINPGVLPKQPATLSAPNSPYVLINPNSTTRTISNSPVASVATEPPTKIIKPEVIREFREPAAITNKSIKNRIAPQ